MRLFCRQLAGLLLATCVYGCFAGCTPDSAPSAVDSSVAASDAPDAVSDTFSFDVPDTQTLDAQTLDAQTLDAQAPTDVKAPDAQAASSCPTVITALTFDKHKVTVALVADVAELRTYKISTTAKPHDGAIDGQRTVKESANYPRLRTCNLVLDALYALAIAEVEQLSVSAVHEGSFNGGKAVPCPCFQTGAKWTWAWTRDVSYAIDLSLALLDPERSKNTLMFKVSKPKAGVQGGVQVVQDTGTGGSWPVSTDRVVWAMGARAVERALVPSKAQQWRAVAGPIVAETLARNHVVAYDTKHKRYAGESSFLDWREQSYPAWMATQPADIAMSHSQSTNTLHATAQQVAEAFTGQATTNATISAFGTAAFTNTALDRAAVDRLDTLGLALSPTSMAQHLRHGPHGPPVLFPQQKHAAIYHNRGQWPFVTAYALLAARKTHPVQAWSWFDELVRGAALNLSNMENYEVSSGAAWVSDGDKSGPVVNSRRQLWSVAGFLAAVHRGVFGVALTDGGLTASTTIAGGWLAKRLPGPTAELRGLRYNGATLTLRLQLPTAPLTGADVLHVYGAKLGPEVGGTSGSKAYTQLIPQDALASPQGAPILVELQTKVTSAPTSASMLPAIADDAPSEAWFAPHAPKLTKLARSGDKITLTWEDQGEKGVSFEVFRDGALVAKQLKTTTWTDDDAADLDTKTHCYSVGARYISSANASQHSAPLCDWGAASWRVQELGAQRLGGLPVTAAAATWKSTWSNAHGKPHWSGWGRWIGAATPEKAEIRAFVPRATGQHLLQLLYGNTAGPINTGIACANKRVRVVDVVTGQPVGSGFAVMPQLGTKHRWGESTVVRVGTLKAGRPYRLIIDEDGGVMNMTYLQHFASYTGGPGGGQDPYNRLDLAGVRVLNMSGTKAPATKASVAFDGANDLDKITKKQWLSPGSTKQTWEKFTLTANASHVSIAAVSAAFEEPTSALLVYLAADTATQPVAVAGMSYLGLVPKLPFTPQWAIGARWSSDLKDGFGPWAGLYWRTPTGAWILQRRFETGSELWGAADKHTVSLHVPWSALAVKGAASNDGKAAKYRVVAHIVAAPKVGSGAPAFQHTVPAAHTPTKSQTSGYFVLSSTATELVNWQLK